MCVMEYSCQEASEVRPSIAFTAVGLTVVIELACCIWDVRLMYVTYRTSNYNQINGFSRNDCITSASARTFESLCGVGAMLMIADQLEQAGVVMGRALPHIIANQILAGRIFAGFLGSFACSFLGKTFGCWSGNLAGYGLVWLFKTANRSRVTLDEIRPGDHLVFYREFSRRLHAIAESIDLAGNRVTVLQNTIRGIERKSVPFQGTVCRIIYKPQTVTYSGPEVLERAQNSLSHQSFRFKYLTQNDKHFCYRMVMVDTPHGFPFGG